MDELKSYIQMLIDRQSEKDAEFKELLSKPNKSIEECAEFLQGEAYKQAKEQTGSARCVGWSDETMLNNIIHYYQEDAIKVEKLPSNVTTSMPKAAKAQEPKQTTAAKVVTMPTTPPSKKSKKESNTPKVQELSLF